MSDFTNFLHSYKYVHQQIWILPRAGGKNDLLKMFHSRDFPWHTLRVDGLVGPPVGFAAVAGIQAGAVPSKVKKEKENALSTKLGRISIS